MISGNPRMTKSGTNLNRPDGVRVTAPKCVRCSRPVEPRFRPFCSQRCADLDLAGWLNGIYRIKTDEELEVSENTIESEED